MFKLKVFLDPNFRYDFLVAEGDSHISLVFSARRVFDEIYSDAPGFAPSHWLAPSGRKEFRDTAHLFEYLRYVGGDSWAAAILANGLIVANLEPDQG